MVRHAATVCRDALAAAGDTPAPQAHLPGDAHHPAHRVPAQPHAARLGPHSPVRLARLSHLLSLDRCLRPSHLPRHQEN